MSENSAVHASAIPNGHGLVIKTGDAALPDHGFWGAIRRIFARFKYLGKSPLSR
jgi:hypothetical protein